jgi:hypothetical protein
VGNRQLTKGSFVDLTLEGDGAVFRLYIKHYIGNRKVRNCQLTEASFANLPLKSDGHAFCSFIKHKRSKPKNEVILPTKEALKILTE